MVENRTVLRYALAFVAAVDGLVALFYHLGESIMLKLGASTPAEAAFAILAMYVLTASIWVANGLLRKNERSRLVCLMVFPGFAVFALVGSVPFALFLIGVNVLAFVAALVRNPVPRHSDPDPSAASISQDGIVK